MAKVREENGARLSRRAVVQGAILAGVAGIGAPLVLRGIGGARAATPVKLTWNANSICTVAVPVAAQRGHFEKHGLKVELINFGGSTDQLLEAIATGKADAGVGMALRWLKPLEQGFDVKLTAGIHGGCMRLLGSKAAGITDLKSLRGKTVAVSDMAAPDKNFFSILLQQNGIDPIKDVEWRQYPADLLGLAVQKGEAQALAAGDPIAWLTQRKFDLAEVATNLIGEYQHRSCCVLGVRGSLVKQDRATATALTRALLEAGGWVAHHPDEAAGVFSQYSTASVADLAAMLRSHTHHHHPVGTDFKGEIARYADELKLVQVIKPGTNSDKFAERVYADVLS